VLEPCAAPPSGSGDAVVSRFKILAGLDIAERRLAQDGRIRKRIDGRKIDLRVVTSPCLHGESVVLRILARDLETPDFEALGFDRSAQKNIDRLLSARHGMVAVTGPTGSGKTTSLYAALDTLNTGARKIITVEDPVEYQVDGVVQTPVRSDIGRGFAENLRSFLRQDPDVIMVGEMRDGETAEIAARAALTGHLVLSTLHTNDAASAVTRLRDMGLEPYLIAATLRGVVAQRLVRRLCPECKAPAANPLASLEAVRQLAGVGVEFNEPVGCDACGGRGYRGRVGVYEIMMIDDEMAQLIVSGADASTLRAAAAGKGMRSLLEDALVKAAKGETSLSEAYAVCGEA
ncbi:MAG: GspE/PulE family protein, partial [Pseudomonadota bacterium]